MNWRKAGTNRGLSAGAIRKQYEFWFERKRYDLHQAVPKAEAVWTF